MYICTLRLLLIENSDTFVQVCNIQCSCKKVSSELYYTIDWLWMKIIFAVTISQLIMVKPHDFLSLQLTKPDQKLLSMENI